MYIWLFSRSVGAGRAITRKTRGLTRSVMALIVPPLPAPSRPSKMTQTLRPLCLTHSCSLTSSTCSFFSSFSYSLSLSSGPGFPLDSLTLALLELMGIQQLENRNCRPARLELFDVYNLSNTVFADFGPRFRSLRDARLVSTLNQGIYHIGVRPDPGAPERDAWIAIGPAPL